MQRSRSRLGAPAFVFLALLVGTACDVSPPTSVDLGANADGDAGDAATVGTLDADVDATVDADGSIDAAVSVDADVDAALDASIDAAVDLGDPCAIN